MRRIIIKEARPGMVAARTLSGAGPDAQPVVIAATGQALTMDHLIKSHELGLYDLWVVDPGLEFCDELCAQPTAAQVRLADGLRDSFLRLSTCLSRALFKRYSLVLQEIVQSILRAAPSVPCFNAFTEDEPLLTHSCDVAALSILLGLQLEGYLVEQRRRLNCRQARDVVNLALGALFHDVGELMLPMQQRESRQAYFENDDWKQHATEGYAIVRGHLDPSAAGVVLHHHQRCDGTGFAGAVTVARPPRSSDSGPRVLAGENIHVYARIVMAADVFCQTSFAGARLPQPMVKTLWQLQQLPLRRAMDPTVLQCLLTMFQPFVEGSVVGLNDQRQAIVIKVDPQLPCYPQVQVLSPSEAGEETHLNLCETAEYRVEVIDGMVIEPFLYGVRKAAPLQAA